MLSQTAKLPVWHMQALNSLSYTTLAFSKKIYLLSAT